MFCKNNKGGQDMGMVYFLGFVGALVYYIQHSTSFGGGGDGVFKGAGLAGDGHLPAYGNAKNVKRRSKGYEGPRRLKKG